MIKAKIQVNINYCFSVHNSSIQNRMAAIQAIDGDKIQYDLSQLRQDNSPAI